MKSLVCWYQQGLRRLHLPTHLRLPNAPFFSVTLSGFNENHCRSALKGLKFRSSDPSDLFWMLFGCFLWHLKRSFIRLNFTKKSTLSMQSSVIRVEYLGFSYTKKDPGKFRTLQLKIDSKEEAMVWWHNQKHHKVLTWHFILDRELLFLPPFLLVRTLQLQLIKNGESHLQGVRVLSSDRAFPPLATRAPRPFACTHHAPDKSFPLPESFQSIQEEICDDMICSDKCQFICFFRWHHKSYPISKRQNFDTSTLEGTALYWPKGLSSLARALSEMLWKSIPLWISSTECMASGLIEFRRMGGVLLSQPDPYREKKKKLVDQPFANVGSFWRFWNASVSTAIKSCCSETWVKAHKTG